MKKIVKYTLIDTQTEFSYEDYLDFCNTNKFNPSEPDSNDYWDWVGEMRSFYYNDEMDNIKFSKENDNPVIVTGSLGLWDSTKTIYPVKYNTLHKAVEKCIGSADNAVVTFENGVICVDAMYHDSTDSLKIHKLSKVGLRATLNWEDGEARDVEVKDIWFKRFGII